MGHTGWQHATAVLLACAMAKPAFADRELDYLYALAEDSFESIVLREPTQTDEGIPPLEAKGRVLAREMWQRVRERDPDAPAARIELRILPDRPVPLAIMGRGKILADATYFRSLSDDAMAAALAHELAHLALEHQNRRLSLGLALMGDAVPGRLGDRVKLAMRLSASPVETQLKETQADEYAIGLLREAGVRGSALVDALEALRPWTPQQRWDRDIEPRLTRIRSLLQTVER